MITNFLILLSTVLSLYAWTTTGNLAFSEYALSRGDYYTLITGIFVHANYIHLAGNMIFFYIFGNSLEDEVGDLSTGIVFFTGGILSFLLSMPFYPGAGMVGASAAIFSVMAAMLLVRNPDLSFKFLSPIGPLAVLFFIFNIAAIQRGAMGNVAYVSHVIGFVVGLFFGALWNRKWVESFMFTLLLLVIYILLYNYLKTVIWL